MRNQIAIWLGILSLLVTIFLPSMTAGFLTLTAPSASGQFMPDNTNEGNNTGSALDITTTNNTELSSNITETSPTITIHDVINSTFIAAKEDEDASDRIIDAVGDRINDLLHTVVRFNATIISTATITNITNELINESAIINNNNTRFLEVLDEQVEIALDRIAVMSQPSDSTLELHTDVEMTCINYNTSLAECDIIMRFP